jgi:hypothetical protein
MVKIGTLGASVVPVSTLKLKIKSSLNLSVHILQGPTFARRKIQNETVYILADSMKLPLWLTKPFHQL